MDEVKDACLGQEVLKGGFIRDNDVTVKIINDGKLVKLLGEGTTRLKEDKPLRVMMVGSTRSRKNNHFRKASYAEWQKEGRKPMLVACDVYRPRRQLTSSRF